MTEIKDYLIKVIFPKTTIDNFSIPRTKYYTALNYI